MSERLIVVASKKGGVGKTFTTLLLMAAWLERGRRVRYRDVDAGQVSLGAKVAMQREGTVLRRASGWEEGEADYALVDSPPRVSREITDLLRSADYVVVPTTHDDEDLAVTTTYIRLVLLPVLGGSDREKYGLLWNRVRGATIGGRMMALVEEQYGLPFLRAVLPQREANVRAMSSENFWEAIDRETREQAVLLADEVEERLGGVAR